MRYLWKLVLTCLLINVHGAVELQEPLIFTAMAGIDVIRGNAAQSACLVESVHGHGSGVLFSLDGRVAVLTSAHIPNPHSVHFLIMNQKVEPPRPEALKCDALKAIPMEEDLRRLTAQTDLQVLLVSGNPEEHVRPLTLSSEIDVSRQLTIYGIGTICAEFVKGKLCADIPSRRSGHLQSKVVIPTFEVAPKASNFHYMQKGFVALFHQLGMFSFAMQKQISPISSRMEGLIHVTTQYDPKSLQTHIGEGFSGGPALQGNNVVGICQSGSLNITQRTTPQTIRLQLVQGIAMWTSYLLGLKLPILQSITPWLCDPVISPSLRFALEKFGYKWLSSPLRMCAFNTAVALLSLLGNKAYVAYTLSPNALMKPKDAWFVRITPEVIDWIRTVLNNPTQTSTAAS